MTTLTNTKAIFARRAGFNPIQWLLNLDAAYRAKSDFRDLNEERLDDIGLTRADQDKVYLRQFMQHSKR